MAAPRVRIGSSDDAENLVARKPNMKSSTVATKREILSELGNKVVAKPHSNISLKQPTKAAGTIVRKPSKASVVIKPLVKEINVETKPILLTRQESVLTQRFREQTVTVAKPTQLSYSSRQLIDVIDIDVAEEPGMVSEYIKDIIKYLMSLEEKYPIKQGFLNEHSTSLSMRSVLINWISEVQTNFKLLPETFHLSVSILDRYLQGNKKVGRETLQLVGTAAIIVACKFEEIFCPEISDFVYICDDSFSRKEILAMEMDVLKMLDYNINRPLSIQFLRRYNKVVKASPITHTLGKYMLELSLFEYEMCHLRPSLQAAAASCLSTAIINNTVPSAVWNKTMCHYTTYSYTDIRDTICDFAALLIKAETSKYQAIRGKYSSSSCGKISKNHKLSGPTVKNYAKQSKNVTP